MIKYSEGSKGVFPEVLDFVSKFPNQLVQTPLLQPPVECLHLARDEGGRLVGCCGFDYYGPKIGEIRWLAVAPEYEGRGVGVRLMRLCLRDAEASGVYQVLAITSECLKRFFGRFGFKMPEESCEALIRMSNGPVSQLPQDRRIRPATESDKVDRAKLIGLYHWLVSDENLLPPMNEYVVAEEYGRVIGCGGLRVYGPKMSEIFGLAVCQDHPERPLLEEQLLVACLQNANKSGAYQTLNITHPTQRALFEKYGFGVFNEARIALVKTFGE